jgi:cytochrome c biogenesis protein CcmG/thiol:disulfide interchange protein DsbE
MDWRRATIGAAVATPLIALLAFGMTRDPRDIPSPLPGRAAPDFTLASFDAATLTKADHTDSVHLAALRGDVVVVNVWASWCLACRDEHPVLREIGSRYAGTDVHFLGILYNDNVDNGRRWIREMGGQSYPALEDPGARTAIDYGVYGVPETFFVGRDGVVAYKHTGPITADVLLAKIEELRKAPTVAPRMSTSPPGAP